MKPIFSCKKPLLLKWNNTIEMFYLFKNRFVSSCVNDHVYITVLVFMNRFKIM